MFGMRRAGLAALLVVSLAACTGSSTSGSQVTVQRAELRPGAPESVAATAPGHVVAKVQFRNHVLVIRSGSGEMRYDVQDRAGLLLASALTRSQLDRQFPDIAGQFRDSTAIHIDASLTPDDRGNADRQSPGR